MMIRIRGRIAQALWDSGYKCSFSLDWGRESQASLGPNGANAMITFRGNCSARFIFSLFFLSFCFLQKITFMLFLRNCDSVRPLGPWDVGCGSVGCGTWDVLEQYQ